MRNLHTLGSLFGVKRLQRAVQTPLFIAACAALTSTMAYSAPKKPTMPPSLCTSEGAPQPTVLHERFISADCETCWAYRPPEAISTNAMVLDWIVPAASGDEAALSAAATRDALVRLDLIDGLGQPQAKLGKPWLHEVPQTVDKRLRQTSKAHNPLRVTLEPALPGYASATINLQPVPKIGIWTVWLALIETIPAGTNGTPTERFVVRNTLKRTLDMSEKLSKKNQLRFFEARAMAYPEGAKAERLGVVGWVEDDENGVVGMARAVCATN